MDKRTKINCECLFCKSTQFEIPEDYTPQDGDTIKCGNCGKLNDFSSLNKIVLKKGEEWAKSQVDKVVKDFEKQIKKMLK